MSRENKYEIDMCNGSIMDKLISFALPLMLSGMLQLMFNAVDIVVVGRFSGSQSLAAVGATTALIYLFTNLFIGISLGANVLAARYYAAGKHEEMSETVHTAMMFALISGIIMIFVGLFFSRLALEIMGTPSDVIDQATLYMRIYFLCMPFFSSEKTAKHDFITLLSLILQFIINLQKKFLLHQIYRGICHTKRLCLFMAVHIDIDVILLNRSTTVFCCKYMSSDDNFCSVWNDTWINCNGSSFCHTASCCCNSICFITTLFACAVVCNLKIPKTCTIHICRCIDFSNASINNYLIIL